MRATVVERNRDDEGPIPRKKPKDRSPIDDGFNRWLDRTLRDIYPVAEGEPIPDDLAQLLKRFGSRGADGGKKGS